MSKEVPVFYGNTARAAFAISADAPENSTRTTFVDIPQGRPKLRLIARWIVNAIGRPLWVKGK